MKFYFIFGFIFSGFLSSQQIYIPVGKAKSNRETLVLEKTIGTSKAAQIFNQSLADDFAFGDFFQLSRNNLSSSSASLEVSRESIQAYKSKGAFYLLKSAVVHEGASLHAEIRLVDVRKGVLLLSRKYPYSGTNFQSAYAELAHVAADDVVEKITGEKSVFRTRLLMSCGRKNKEIYMMNFNGKGLKQLTFDGNFALSPSWGPRGNKIIFTSYLPSKKGGFVNPNLYSFDVQTKKRSLVTASPGMNSGAVYHPTKNLIAYTYSNKGNPEIFLLNPGAKKRTPVTKSHFFSIEPDWSPDGEQLVFSSSKSGKPHIYIAQASGRSQRQLTFAGYYNSSPSWSPKGDQIVFAGQDTRSGNFNLFSIAPNGSNLERLTKGSASKESPSVSPDGRFVAYSSNEGGVYRVRVLALQTGKITEPLSSASLGHCKQPAWSPQY